MFHNWNSRIPEELMLFPCALYGEYDKVLHRCKIPMI